MNLEISLLEWSVVKAADLCFALGLTLHVPFLWTRVTFFLLRSRLENMGIMHVAPGARSAGGRRRPCALLCSVFVAALFPVDLVACIRFKGNLKGKFQQIKLHKLWSDQCM